MGRGAAGALSFSYFFAGRRKGGERTGANSLRRLPGAVLGGGITFSARKKRDRARKAPAAAQRCQQGARAAGPPPGLEAGGPSHGGCAARPRCPLPCLHSSPPHPHPLQAPEVRGAGAERRGECGRGAWAWGLAGKAWGAREGAGPARRRARELEVQSGAPGRREPAAGAARPLRRRSGASAAATADLRLGWPGGPRGPGECEAGAGRPGAGLLHGPRACGRSFQRERAGNCGRRLLN